MTTLFLFIVETVVLKGQQIDPSFIVIITINTIIMATLAMSA